MTITWPIAFAATLTIELPLVIAASPKELRRRALLDGALANLFTHPLAWWLVVDQQVDWWLVEAAVVLVEGTVYRGVTKMRAGRAFAVALLANGVSAALGLILF